MMLIDPLMIEHRLMEEMIELLRDETPKIRKANQIDPVFVDTAVDFIRTYKDRTHRRKEDNILFRGLRKKNMSQEDQRLMQALIEEHRYGRMIVEQLVAAKQGYLQGQKHFLVSIVDKLNALVRYYPEHIRKEDELFFLASMEYLSKEEQEAMVQEFWELDRKMIHEKYTSVVEQLRGT